jgi:hypothetical protein
MSTSGPNVPLATTNASCITHPNLPIAYSLIMRHDGSYSGFSMCKTAINTKNNAAAQNVMRAAVTEN